MNRQEVFTTVARHLLTQNEKSMNGVSCRYRDEEGRSCAVGCLIADEHYDGTLIEGLTVDTERVKSALAKSGVEISSPQDIYLLDNLQVIHDEYAVDTWEHNLRSIAYSNDLKWEL